MRVAFISMHPAPYRNALIEELVGSFTGEMDVFNLYDSDAGHRFWDLPEPKYKAKCIVGDRDNISQFRLSLRLLRMFVFSRKYDCIVWPGYVQWSVRAAILLSALFRRKYVLSIDSVEQPPIGKLAFGIKKWMIGHATTLFVPGEASKIFLMRTFEVPEEKIICGAYALDGAMLEKRILELRHAGVRGKMRAKLGIDQNAKVFLMVANMIPTRRYLVTSAGFVKFADCYGKCVFVMVGKGPEYEQVSLYAKEHVCLKTIEGCSFDDMLKLYAASDVYVHGGKEPASTALVIGGIAHLPMISSAAVGCSLDILVDGETGFMVSDYTSIDSWSEAFARAVNNYNRWEMMGAAARTLSGKFDADVVAHNLLEKLGAI